VDFADPATALLSVLSTIALFVTSGVVPFVNAELAVIALGAMAPPPLLPVLLVVATLAHMAGKSLTYLAGRGTERVPWPWLQRRVAAARERLGDRTRTLGAPLIFVSAVAGLPPVYLVTVASGVVGYRFAGFFLLGFVGRLLRFGALLLLPELARTFGWW
jgi:membrane protein YqaA with SNARE-associated domain